MKKLLILLFLIAFSVFGGKKEIAKIRQEAFAAKNTADSAIVIAQEIRNLLNRIEATQKEIIKKQEITDVLIKDLSLTRIEDAEVQLVYLTEAFRDLYSQVKDIRLIPLIQQAQKTALRPSGFTVSTATQTLGGDEYSLYSRGLDAYRNGFFEESRQFFREILNSFPNGKYSDRAHFWIAESYFSQKNYSQALQHYQAVFSFKGSAKEDDAQYRIGISYMLLGENDKALEELTKFIQRYPASELISKANEVMREVSVEKSKAAIKKIVDEFEPESSVSAEEEIEIVPEQKYVQKAAEADDTRKQDKELKDKSGKEAKKKAK